MQFKRWSQNRLDKQLAAELAEECNVDAFVALVAAGRGYSDPVELEQLLSPEVIMADPYELSDMERAVEVISDAIYADELIAVFGDYDVDGVTATALLYSYLKEKGARVIYAIPDREKDGYGINMAAVDRLRMQNVDLIITVDNGIAAIDEIEYAKSLGIKVVVTDHHLPSDIIPRADAVIDPHRPDDLSEFKEVCGVMVAFKLVCALEGKSPEEMLYEFSDLVAIGTVADVMPLVNENRAVVREGVNLIIDSARIGIYALLKASGIEPESLTASRIAYSIAPRLNAAGRMGDAARAVELLLCEDEEVAKGLSETLCHENIKRQSLEKEIFAEAVKSVEKKGYKHNRVIVVEGENWHGGVIGIVAARLCEKYGRPAIVLSCTDGVANGSARSIEGFSIHDAIQHCSYLLSKFGGHEMAAGITLPVSYINDFRRAINEYAADLERVYPEIRLDCKLNPSALCVDLAEDIKSLEPFGAGNPVPLFGIFNLTVDRITTVGKGNHLRLTLSREGVSFNAMMFGTTPNAFGFDVGDTVDVVVTLDTNEYNGSVSLTVSIKGIRPSGCDWDKILVDTDEYESFKSGLGGDYSAISPNRQEVASVYREILKNETGLDKLVNKTLSDIGPAKTLIAAEALCELGVCALYDREGIATIRIANKDKKVNLEDCEILHKLKREEGEPWK